VAIFYLLDSMLVVIRGDRNVSAIDNFKARLEGVDCKGNVISPIKRKTARTCANTSRAEASSRTIRCPSIERCTEEGDVKQVVFVLGQALMPRKFGKSCDARKNRIGSHFIITWVDGLIRILDIVERHLVDMIIVTTVSEGCGNKNGVDYGVHELHDMRVCRLLEQCFEGGNVRCLTFISNNTGQEDTIAP